MIEINETTSASDHIRHRARFMWCRTKDLGDKIIARVVPHGYEFNHKHKDRRLVEVDLLNQTAQCVSLETGEECAANSFGTLCSHVYRTLQQIARNQKRRAA